MRGLRNLFTSRPSQVRTLKSEYDGLEAMPATVRLNDVVDALDMQFDELISILDLDTGQVQTLPDGMLGEAEECEGDEEPDLLEWEEADWEIAKRVVSTGRYVLLPDKYDVHDWAIMEDFVRSVESTRIREELLRAIYGKGAFRVFKDAIRRHGIESAWFEFRTAALRQIAIDWCEENQIKWE